MMDMVKVIIDSIRVGLMSQQRVVLLREIESDKYLTIWIDPYMAEQITYALQDIEVARPISHDLIKNVIRELDARVVQVEIVSLKDQVFYGNIVIENNKGEIINIDSRPSDALALAVRVNVPILVTREVMEEAGSEPEEGIAEIEVHAVRSSAKDSPAVDLGEERLSVFEDFLEKIDPTLGSDIDDDDEN